MTHTEFCHQLFLRRVGVASRNESEIETLKLEVVRIADHAEELGAFEEPRVGAREVRAALKGLATARAVMVDELLKAIGSAVDMGLLIEAATTNAATTNPPDAFRRRAREQWNAIRSAFEALR